MRNCHIFTARMLTSAAPCALAIALISLCGARPDVAAASFRERGEGHHVRPTHDSACDRVAYYTFASCQAEAKAEYYLAIAKSWNLPSGQEQAEARRDALEELRAASEECRDEYEARLEACEDLGGGIYNPEIDPADFVGEVTNPYFPLPPGTTWIYEGMTEDGLERNVFQVTAETKEIMGVTCVVVRDTETVDDVLKEDTFDWFAQDKAGNVWYFGERSLAYEDGELVGLAGSWEAGVDGALPGIIMEAAPKVGDVYRQEYAIGDAEDMGKVGALGQSVSVPYGSFEDCLMTEDFSPAEPGALEHKFYAPGIGFVLSIDTTTGERSELVQIEHQ